jgi:hypothetical protein
VKNLVHSGFPDGLRGPACELPAGGRGVRSGKNRGFQYFHSKAAGKANKLNAYGLSNSLEARRGWECAGKK